MQSIPSIQGLKVKRIKSLCYEQLKRMSAEEITRALQREETTPVDVSTAEITSSSGGNQVPVSATVDRPKDFVEKAGKEKVRQTAQVSSRVHHEKDSNPLNLDPSSESNKVSVSTAKQSKNEENEDVSDEGEGKREAGEGERKKGRKYGDTSTNSNNKPTVLKDEYSVTSLRVSTHKKQESIREKSETKTFMESQNVEMENENTDNDDVTVTRNDVINIDDVMSETDTCEGTAASESSSGDEGSDLDVEVSELDATKLLEMEMRRRALESELRKFSQSTDQMTMLRNRTSLDDDGSASDEVGSDFLALHVSESESGYPRCQHSRDDRKQKTVPLQQGDSRDAGANEVTMEMDTMDIGQLLEMKLRQKALQSLLSKKKQTSSMQ